MQITLLTPHYQPHFEGGTEFAARAQARALSRRGHGVRIVSGTDRPHRGEDVEEALVDGLAVRFLPRLPGEVFDLALARPRLDPLLRAEIAGSDLVHVHHWSTLTGSVVRDLTDAGVPVVVTLHDLFATCPRFFRVPPAADISCPAGEELESCASCIAPEAPGWSTARLLAGLRERRAAFAAELDAAAAIVCPSASHAERIARHLPLPTGRVHIVPHGLCVEFEPAPEGARTSLAFAGAAGETLRVLFLGHLGAAKGAGDLVRALRDLPGVELLLLGAEVESGCIGELRRAAGATPLTFGGAYRVEELARRVAELGGAHLVALPSRVAESYGLVLDEALALGLPAWVSDRGAPPERVGSAGRVLPAENPSRWRASFEEVLADPALLAAERAAVPERTRTARQAAVELESIYRDLLS